MPAVSVGELEATLGLDTKGFSAGIAKAGKSLQKFGGNVTSAGKSLTKGLTLPIVAAAGLSVKAAADFESSFAGVRKTVDATEAEFKAFEKDLRNLALEVPINVNELNAIAEAAGQLGIEKKNIISFTKTMAQLGVTTNLTSEEAATGFARFANITQLPQKEIANLGSTVVDLGNNLATTEKEILDMSLRLAGAGSQIGLTEDQILGFAGALSSVGIRAEAGGTAFSKVMIDIAQAVSNGGEAVKGFAEVAGVSAKDFAESFEKTPARAIQAFVAGLGRMSDEGENVFGVLDELDLSSIRVRDTLLRASGAGELVGKSLGIASKAFKENTALAKEAEQRFVTFESKMTLFKNSVQDLGITFGNILLPMLLDVVNRVRPLIESFRDLSPRTKRIIVVVGLLAAAIGPLLIVIGSLVGAVGTLTTVLLPVIGTVALVAAGIAALIAIGVLLIKNWASIKKNNKELFDAIGESVREVVREARPLIKEFIELMVEGSKLVKRTFEKIWPLISDEVVIAAKVIKAVIGTKIKLALNSIKIGMQILQGDWEGAWKSMKEQVKITTKGIIDIIKPLKDEIVNFLDRTKVAITEKLEDWKEAFEEWFVATAILTKAKLEELGNSIANWLESIPSRIKTRLQLWGIAIEEWFDSMPERILSKLENWTEALNKWTEEQNEKNKKQFEEWGKSIIEWFESMPTEIADSLILWRQSIFDWFEEMPGKIAKKLEDWKTAFEEWFVNMVATIKGGLDGWWIETKAWLKDLPKRFTDKLDDLKDSIVQWFKDLAKNTIFRDTGKEMMEKTIGGTEEKKQEFIDRLGKVIVDVMIAVGAAVLVATVAAGREIIKRIIEGVTNGKEDLKEAILGAIQGAIDSLVNIKIPKIPLPHFSITGEFDLNPIGGVSAPSVGVDWFAKGGIFTAPSIIGVGEKGPEAVIPLSQLGEITGGGGDTFQIENINVNVPDGRVDTFMSELNKQTRTANLRNRVINNGS